MNSYENESTKKILFVDDDRDFLNILAYSFKAKQMDVDFAYDVDEALKKAQEKKYDLICSDYEMGDRNGLDLLKHLRNGNDEVKFIMLTGKDSSLLQNQVEKLRGIFLEKGMSNLIDTIMKELN